MTMPKPVTFQDAIKNIAPNITYDDSAGVELEDTPENDALISAVATVFNLPEDQVMSALIDEIEKESNEPIQGQEMINHLTFVAEEKAQRPVN